MSRSPSPIPSKAQKPLQRPEHNGPFHPTFQSQLSNISTYSNLNYTSKQYNY
ncbi:9340_t:CDS:2 [Acaulospora morrowiae]|uniref:9340_t:CDS:1 n=1 Tax=Acaulospora morrowiae TaxID=94023 RepID=A0A9N9F3R0_9GLOM|nr:9340_t:CDS:2 [Acaulospora morrowiae]